MHPGDRPPNVVEFRDMLISGPIESPLTLARREAQIEQVARALKTHRRVAIGVSLMIVVALLVTLFAAPIQEPPLGAPTPTATTAPR
jgi:hypothetical protein